MTRSVEVTRELVITSLGTVCSKCHHKQDGVSVIRVTYRKANGKTVQQHICWKCCHDAEGTLLFHQKYHSVLDRVLEGQWWYLRPRYEWMLFQGADYD